MKKLLIIILVLIMATGCGSIKKTTVETTSDSTRVEIKKDSSRSELIQILHDTVIKYASDSSLVDANFECDSNNQVLIKQINELKSGNKIKQDFKFENGHLTIKNIINEDSVKVYWKEFYERSYKEKLSDIKTDSTIETTKETVKKQSLWTYFKWILIAFALGLLIGFTKNFWIKLFIPA